MLKFIHLALMAVSIIVNTFSLSAQAQLTSYNNNGVDLVYSSASDVSWAKNANLLASMIQQKGYDAMVAEIIQASNGINFSSTPHNLNTSDFSKTNLGYTTWWGAMAFVHYLNKTAYGNITSWRLPSVANNDYSRVYPTNGATAGDELRELFYSELNGQSNSAFPDSALFSIAKRNAIFATATEPQNDNSCTFIFVVGNQTCRPQTTEQLPWPILNSRATSSSIMPINTSPITKTAFSINAAFYGKEGQPTWEINGQRIVDIIIRNTTNGKILIPPNMNQYFGGDPLPNQPKIVAVQIQVGNQVLNLRQAEGKALQYPGVEGTDYWIVK